MTIRELRKILFDVESQDAKVEFWYKGEIIDVAEVIPQPPLSSSPDVVSLLINS